MNTAIILAAGVGQRMRSGGLPKQFLQLMGKPIIIYTLEKFQNNEEIDQIIIVCHGSYIEHMKQLVDQYHIDKVKRVLIGGSDRQKSIMEGLRFLKNEDNAEDDIVVIHDGVRPLVSDATIYENIRVAKLKGNAVTVHSVTESVLVSEGDNANIDDFQKRSETKSLTSPQSFILKDICLAYELWEKDDATNNDMPLLDAAMIYASKIGKVSLVKEQGVNIKITTPEDFYFLKAILELEENRSIFGL